MYGGDKKCPSCGQTGSSKYRCEKCGRITCTKCEPKSTCDCGGKKKQA